MQSRDDVTVTRDDAGWTVTPRPRRLEDIPRRTVAHGYLWPHLPFGYRWYRQHMLPAKALRWAVRDWWHGDQVGNRR